MRDQAVALLSKALPIRIYKDFRSLGLRNGYRLIDATAVGQYYLVSPACTCNALRNASFFVERQYGNAQCGMRLQDSIQGLVSGCQHAHLL
jgi:hypothetical protein